MATLFCGRPISRSSLRAAAFQPGQLSEELSTFWKNAAGDHVQGGGEGGGGWTPACGCQNLSNNRACIRLRKAGARGVAAKAPPHAAGRAGADCLERPRRLWEGKDKGCARFISRPAGITGDKVIKFPAYVAIVVIPPPGGGEMGARAGSVHPVTAACAYENSLIIDRSGHNNSYESDNNVDNELTLMGSDSRR